MDFRIRIAGYIGLFVFYAVQLVVISYDMNDEIKGDNPEAYHGLVGVDAMLLVVATIFLVLKWLTIPIVDRLVVLFDSLIFALSYSWLVLAAPLVNVLTGFFVLNITIAMGIIVVDIYDFGQFSSSYSRIRDRAKSNVSSATINPLQDLQDHDQDDHDDHDEHDKQNKQNTANNTTNTIDGDVESGFGQEHHGETVEDMQRRVVAVRLGANAKEVKYMPPDLDLTKKGVLDGFRVNLGALPEIDETIPRELPWSTFEDVTHTVDSSSCHIYTARWGDTPVILKLIKEDRINSPVALAEFDIEERVLSRVRHPHIVRLLGSGIEPRKYLVLEFLSGGTLSSTLGVQSGQTPQRWLKKFTLLETLKLAHGLAEALNYLHNDWSSSVHIIHRDLKPDNIGWSDDGVLKLFDFGLSVSVRAQRERTEQYRLTGNTGTLRYMAPEVVLGRSYHQSVDTYSFGILIWQVAAGQVPFKEMGKKTYFDKVVIKGVRPVLDPRWPAPFSELLRSCWHEDKNARPSFAEITTHLAQLVKDEEATVRENNNHCVVRCASGTLYYVHLLRPLCFVVSLLLLGAAFAMTTAKQAEVDNYVPGAAILAAVSALVVYASALSYLCDAWPLVPLLDPAAKLNFSIDEEGSHLHSPITGSKNNKKKKSQQEAPDAGIELTMTAIKCSVVETEMEAKPDTKESLFGAARKANNKGILSNKKSAATAGAGGEGAAAEGAAASEDLEMGGYRNQPRSGSSKGILGSLQKVARGRANKQQKRDDISGAENVTFSPLSSMSDV